MKQKEKIVTKEVEVIPSDYEFIKLELIRVTSLK